MIVVNAPVFEAGSGALTIDYLGAWVMSGSGTSRSATISLGAAAADREIVVLAQFGHQGSYAPTMNSISIAGIAADFHAYVSDGSVAGGLSGIMSRGITIVSAQVPTGTTGAVAATFSTSAPEASIRAYRVAGLASRVAQDTVAVSNFASSISSGTLDVPAGGTIFALGAAGALSSAAFTTGGFTEDQRAVENFSNNWAAGGRHFSVAGETGRNVSATTTSFASYSGKRTQIVAASFL